MSKLLFSLIAITLIIISETCSCQSIVDSSKIFGETHFTGYFKDKIYNSKLHSYRAPIYEGVFEDILNDEKGNLLEFQPFGINPFKSVKSKSKVIFIFDSGVEYNHPLLKGKIIDTLDFTGEGITDNCGHGTIVAIHHVLYEKDAKLIIVKITGNNCKPILHNVINAFNFLSSYKSNVEMVFMAGGFQSTANSSISNALCNAVKKLQESKGTEIVATIGNSGVGKLYFPANCNGVSSFGVMDKDTYEPSSFSSSNTDKNLNRYEVLQKGKFTSFPDINSITIDSFYFCAALKLQKANLLKPAIEYTNNAISYNDKIEYRLLLAELFVSNNDLISALKTYQNLLNNSANPKIKCNIYKEIGKAHFREDKNEKNAFEAFHKALSFSKNDGEIQSYLSKIYAKRGEVDSATYYMISAAKCDRNQIDNLHLLATSLFYSRRFKNVIQINSELTNLDPTYKLAYYSIMTCYSLLGNEDSAKYYLLKYEKEKKIFDGSDFYMNTQTIKSFIDSSSFESKLISFIQYPLLGKRLYLSQYKEFDLVLKNNSLSKNQLTIKSSNYSDSIYNAFLHLSKNYLKNNNPLLKRLPFLFKYINANYRNLLGDSILYISCLQQIGYIQLRLGEYENTLKTLSSILNKFAVLPTRLKETIYTDIGFTYLCMQKFDSANNYFNSAYTTSFVIGPNTSYCPRLHTGKSATFLWNYILNNKDSSLLNVKGIKQHLEWATNCFNENDLKAKIETSIIYLQLGTFEDSIALQKAYLTIKEMFDYVLINSEREKIFLRTLDDYPFYNVIPKSNETIRTIFFQYKSSISNDNIFVPRILPTKLDSILKSFTSWNLGNHFKSKEEKERKVVIVGGGIPTNFNTLKEYIVNYMPLGNYSKRTDSCAGAIASGIIREFDGNVKIVDISLGDINKQISLETFNAAIIQLTYLKPTDVYFNFRSNYIPPNLTLILTSLAASGCKFHVHKGESEYWSTTIKVLEDIVIFDTIATISDTFNFEREIINKAVFDTVSNAYFVFFHPKQNMDNLNPIRIWMESICGNNVSRSQIKKLTKFAANMQIYFAKDNSVNVYTTDANEKSKLLSLGFNLNNKVANDTYEITCENAFNEKKYFNNKLGLKSVSFSYWGYSNLCFSED